MSSCAFLKILEYCLLPTFERYVRLSPNQFGYRNGTSSLMCAYAVKEMIQKYISNGTPVFSCSLDMSKAFDCLNHFTLINKLIEMGLPSNVISVVKVMYFNQSCYTNYNHAFSGSNSIHNGIRQGGILSGILFNIYVNELITKANKTDYGCKLNFRHFAVTAYADDIFVTSASQSGLQKLIYMIETELNNLNLELNSSKCKAIKFCSGSFHKCMKIKINGKIIDQVESVKYLGIVFQHNLCVLKDIERAQSSFLRQFYGFFSKFSNANLQLRLRLFNMYCTSFYGSSLWSDLSGASKAYKAIGISYHKELIKF